jgi:hypothetical protein
MATVGGTLAAVRALGARGIRVTVAGSALRAGLRPKLRLRPGLTRGPDARLSGETPGVDFTGRAQLLTCQRLGVRGPSRRSGLGFSFEGRRMLGAGETSRSQKAQIASVVRLLDRVICEREAWDTVSETEWRLLNEVGVLTGQKLLPEACNSASALMGFLVVARFILERRSTLPSKVDIH